MIAVYLKGVVAVLSALLVAVESGGDWRADVSAVIGAVLVILVPNAPKPEA